MKQENVNELITKNPSLEAKIQSQAHILRADYCEDATSITEHPDVQRLIAQTIKLQAENRRLKEALNLILNENFSGQSTLSPYAKREADKALKGKQ